MKKHQTDQEDEFIDVYVNGEQEKPIDAADRDKAWDEMVLTEKLANLLYLPIRFIRRTINRN